MKKRCSKCKDPKELEEFYFCRSGQDRRRSECKVCCEAAAKKRRQENPEKTKAIQRRYYQENSEKHALAAKKWRQENPEKVKARAHKWQRENPERARAASKKWWAKNGKKYSTRRKASGLMSRFGITFDEYHEMLAAQGNCCAICGEALGNDGRQPCVDHDHSKKGRESVRGIVHQRCNLYVGFIEKNPELFEKIYQYLEKHSVRCYGDTVSAGA